MSSTSKPEDMLARQFAFYGSYHNNPWNQLIHVIFVPLIWWSFAVLFATSGPLVGPAKPTICEPNAALFLLLAYVIYYFMLGDYPVALSYNAFLTVLYLSALHVARTYPDHVITVFIVGQLLGWGMQIIVGHTLIEGRKAALLDSLFEAVFMAPLFTWYEVLFFFGFRKDFKARVQVLVDDRIKMLDAGIKMNAAINAATTSPSQEKPTSAKPSAKTRSSSRKAQ